MLGLGIIGFYIAGLYDEIKGSSKFIVSETCGKDGGKDEQAF